MSDVVYTTDELSVSIGKKTILHSLKMSIESGACTSIIGPNGAGKTTLLKCLNRILKPDSGEIRLHDKPLSSYSQKEIAREVAYVPQASGLVFSMSVYNFIMLGRYPHMSPFTAISSEDRAAVEYAMEQAQISEFRDRPLDTLSGGERQAAFIAAALAQGGKVLLMDEPTTYLDYGHQVDVLGLVRKLHREQNLTVVLVTHDVNHAVLVSDHIVALKEGAIVFDGTPESLLEPGTLEAIYDTAFSRLDDDGQVLPVVMPTEGGV